MTPRAIVWFRRDLRLSDNRTLRVALDECAEIIPLFVIDERFWGPSGTNRRWFLRGCLADLDDQLDGRLVVRHGDPATVISDLVGRHGITRLYRADDAGPCGRRRDAEVDEALQGEVTTVVADQPYLTQLGALRTTSGDPFKVFTPYWRRWSQLDVPAVVARPRRIDIVADVGSDGIPDPGEPTAAQRRIEPGERAAQAALDRFSHSHLSRYGSQRNSPGADATSRLGAFLKYGCLHPRQLLRRVDRGRSDEETFARELAWRDFYADVLHAWPDSAWKAFNPAMAELRVDEGRRADERFAAWCEGRTGFPIVDAGMRQLVATGFMHNRVRMIVASFLVKDLHLDWTRGARFFLHHLFDGDLPSNNHGWQWVAGTGTDAAPYYRIFNPARQGARFDPDGEYVRRWVPELAGVEAARIQDPHAGGDGPAGYPGAIVDHAAEREEVLWRYADLTAAR